MGLNVASSKKNLFMNCAGLRGRYMKFLLIKNALKFGNFVNHICIDYGLKYTSHMKKIQ